ncbi:hypothetical protein GVN16_03360 [Emticicia sp. CRIBPO]|uniref:hypothetical protein n=1 Tax=Emticicia sp. CRIBPO TaxID=2683258 RepID=UPI0014136278|nr:hypothetical protein [Emticicia sp. CRIBPO]NBA84778.1 hypothetical protein [Emticicia sp. CRIBPO]
MKENEDNKFLQHFSTKFGSYGISYYYDKEDDTICITLPGEEEEISYFLGQFLSYIKEIDSLKPGEIYDKVSTTSYTQRIVHLSGLDSFYWLSVTGAFIKKIENKLTINIIFYPFLIGLSAIIEGFFDENHPPLSNHFALEIHYHDPQYKLDDRQEIELIKSYMFELSNLYELSFTFGNFRFSKHDEEATQETVKRYDLLESKQLEKYHPAMDLFISANQNISSDLRFLTYYKIFEYFGPIQSRMDAYKSMKLKLNSSEVFSPNSGFISSIFSIAKEYDIRLNDKELIKPLINKAFDLVDIYKYLPNSIRVKQLKNENLTYRIKDEKLDVLIDTLGKILYSTRNSIVHAKSNFNPNGLECKYEEIEQLNKFMHKACYSIIRWYNDLPDYLKLEISNK